MEDPVSIHNSRKHMVTKLVQKSKDTVKNEPMQGPPKWEHKQLQLKLLRTLLKNMVETYAKKASAGVKTAEASRTGVSGRKTSA